jgi:hypothetical protein
MRIAASRAPPLVGNLLRDFHTLGLQLSQRGADVVAHQVELLTAATVGMNGELGRGQGKDRPPPARVNRRQPEHVGEESADFLGFG